MRELRRLRCLKGCNTGLVFCVLTLFTKPLGAADSWGTAHGPLDGKNLHAPYIPWLSFPANSAASLPPETIRVGTALYFLNEFVARGGDRFKELPIAENGKFSRDDQKELILIDYESTVVEFNFDWQASVSWRFSVDWRMHFRYGGFFDGLIEWWHGLLKVPNGSREYFDNDRSYWNIRREVQWQGEGVAVGSGDLDLQALWSFWSSSELFLGAAFALKLPIGSSKLRFGSGFPDIGTAFLLDWNPWNRWGFYLNTGLIIPLAGEGRPMIQVIPAIEFRISPLISALIQLNIQSSPFVGETRFIHRLFGSNTIFTLPQTNLKVGLKGHVDRLGWQIYVEEDFLTWEGADILFYMGVTWSFR